MRHEVSRRKRQLQPEKISSLGRKQSATVGQACCRFRSIRAVDWWNAAGGRCFGWCWCWLSRCQGLRLSVDVANEPYNILVGYAVLHALPSGLSASPSSAGASHTGSAVSELVKLGRALRRLPDHKRNRMPSADMGSFGGGRRGSDTLDAGDYASHGRPSPWQPESVAGACGRHAGYVYST